jgi:pepF/M3 family oligoendopeptidase
MPGTEVSPTAVPRWDLSPIYPGIDSPRYTEAKARLADLSRAFIAHVESRPAAGSPALAEWLAAALDLESRSRSLHETLAAFTYASFSTNTRDAAAVAEMNAVEELGLSLKRALVLFRNALAERAAEIEELISSASNPRLSEFAFHVREELFWQSRQMAPELEDLASDLQRSGGDAWGRLQESTTSSASIVWDERLERRPSDSTADAQVASGAAAVGPLRKTLVELRNLAYDPDRALREKAYRLELALCESLEIPVAAALNGVKGWTVSLAGRRGWDSVLDKSLRQARITRATLDALVSAMEDSLPSWRRYLRAKAALLGISRCAFYDIFAPLSGVDRKFTFPEAREYIASKFSAFDPEMGDFARRAFEERWIDAEPREGKIGGAYCIDFPDASVSRVMCNFDGSFGSVSTVAHELGHAWHAERVRSLPYVYTQYPMTLAETASIFSETLIFESALAEAEGVERTALIELRLQDACQVIVDILSRFYFEKAVFDRRAKSELPPAEFKELMLDAQKRTYGDGLDPERLHPYMWLVKGHYYSPDLAFYNFPYAFGLLFGAGLYARYEEEGPAFAAAYRGILEDTGRMSAVELAAKAGFDIEKPDFWLRGLGVFARLTDELASAAGRVPPVVA